MTRQSIKKTPETLRSARWFAPDDLRAFGHRSRAMQMGYAPEEWKGRPIIAIVNTWSDVQPCHMHFKSRVEDVKRGVLMAGGFPVELPALSLSESLQKPTTMLYRNLLAMDAEELLRGHPVDGVVLMGGCDKTTPGLLLGATSMNLPTIYLPAGPMLRGNWKGRTLGSGSDAWKYWDERRGGNLRQGLGRCRGRHRAQLRHLHDHGYRFHHDGDCGVDRHDLAGRVVNPGGGCRPHSHELGMRTAHRRDGVGRSDPAKNPEPKSFRERHHGGDGDGLLDQCDHPSDRADAPRGAGYRARRFRKSQPQGAGDRQCAAERRHLSNGEFFSMPAACRD